MNCRLDSIDLRLLPELRLVIYEYNNHNFDILSALRTSGLPCSIEYIALVVPYDVILALYDIWWNVEERLAAILTAPGAYPCLKAVYFVLVVPSDETTPSVEDFGWAFPCVLEPGLFRCVIETPDEVEAMLKGLEIMVGK